MQMVVGAPVRIGVGAATAAVLAAVLKPTVGLKVDEDDRIDGLDRAYRGLEPDVVTHADNLPRG